MKRILILAFGAVSAVSQATIFTFDIDQLGNGSALPQGYGDNVTSANMGTFHYEIANGTTPDILVSYAGSPGGQTDVNWWSTGYSDLTNVMEYEPDGAPVFSVTFTGTNGANAVLNSFDLGNFGASVILPGLTVRNGSGTILWQQTNIAVASSSSPHLSFNVGGLSASVLTLEVNVAGLGGNSDNIGLDNISFSQDSVPEPISMLGLAAFGLIAARRRK
ncbi:MAG: PEP-CTERM sorting domain-containing protein [Fimbriimonadaceae bacterium]